jgi:hypothetical protein
MNPFPRIFEVLKQSHNPFCWCDSLSYNSVEKHSVVAAQLSRVGVSTREEWVRVTKNEGISYGSSYVQLQLEPRSSHMNDVMCMYIYIYIYIYIYLYRLNPKTIKSK